MTHRGKPAIVFLLILALMASGCASHRFTTTIGQSKVQPQDLSARKLNIISIKTVSSNPLIAPLASTKPVEYMKAATERYPSLFSGDEAALPVTVKLSVRNHSPGLSMIPTLSVAILTLGTLPAYNSMGAEYDVETVIYNKSFTELCRQNVGFERIDASWVTVFTPLGLLPVPGRSDIPRAYSLSGKTSSSTELTMRSTVDAVAEAARECGVQGRLKPPVESGGGKASETNGGLQ